MNDLIQLLLDIEQVLRTDDGWLKIRLRQQIAKLQKEDRENFNKHLQNATEIVSKWPLWKQNLLADSSKQQFALAREPVIN